MDIDHMVKMANEIGTFFASDPDREQGVRSVANHLRRYWDPRMRRQMIAYFHTGAGGLSELSRSAVALLAAEAGKQSEAGKQTETGTPP